MLELGAALVHPLSKKWSFCFSPFKQLKWLKPTSSDWLFLVNRRFTQQVSEAAVLTARAVCLTRPCYGYP